MSARLTQGGTPPPPPPPLPAPPSILRSVGVLGPVRFPILSVGSSARQLNAQAVAGPLPKSIPSTWHVRPHRQRVLAYESSMFLKPSPQGGGACATPAERGRGVRMAEEEDDARKKKVPRTSATFAVLKWFINMHFINRIHALLQHLCIKCFLRRLRLQSVLKAALSIFRETKHTARTNRRRCTDSNVSTKSKCRFFFCLLVQTILIKAHGE